MSLCDLSGSMSYSKTLRYGTGSKGQSERSRMPSSPIYQGGVLEVRRAESMMSDCSASPRSGMFLRSSSVSN